MTQYHYELRVRGPVPPDSVLAELGTGPVVQRPETVLVTARLDQGALRDLLLRIADLGLDIWELRRLPGRASPARPSPTARVPDRRAG